MRVACACGWQVTGDEDDVVEATQGHGVEVHNMEVSREQVLAMSVPED